MHGKIFANACTCTCWSPRVEFILENKFLLDRSLSVFFPLSFSFAYLNKQGNCIPVIVSLSYLHAKLGKINYGKLSLSLLFHFIITMAWLESRTTIGSYKTMGNRSNQNALKPKGVISRTNDVLIGDKWGTWDIITNTSRVASAMAFFECCDFIRRKLLGIRHVNIAGLFRNAIIRFLKM